MVRIFLLASCVAIFCFPERRLRAQVLNSVEVKVIVVSDDGTTKESLEQIDPGKLADTFIGGPCSLYRYVKDPYSYSIELRPSGKFRCGRHQGQCALFDEACAAGDWRLEKDGVTFMTQEFTGSFKERPLKPMRVLKFHGRYMPWIPGDLDQADKNDHPMLRCLFPLEASKEVQAFLEPMLKREKEELIKRVLEDIRRQEEQKPKK
jgi:hypothetical protein